MTIDKHTLDQAKKWAGEILDLPRPQHSLDKAIAAAEVIQSLPDVIVDGDKVWEMIETYEHARDGNAEGSEGWMINHLMVGNLNDLLPAPKPQVEIALGAWAMHPEHGKVLIISEYEDDDGEVLVTWEGLESFHSEIGRWVPAADLSPLPDDQFSYLPEAAQETLKASVEDYKAGRFVDVDLDQGANGQGSLDSSPEPQPGEAWLVRNPDGEYRNYICDEEGDWNGAHDFVLKRNATPICRLVPAQEPRVLTTEADYENAAQNTVVRRSDDAPAIEKVDIGTWWSTEGHSYHDDDMAGTSRTVLWEPEE